MKKDYKILPRANNIYEVEQITIRYGKRLDAYESEPDTIERSIQYRGNLSDCYAFIKLKEHGYM